MMLESWNAPLNAEEREKIVCVGGLEGEESEREMESYVL